MHAQHSAPRSITGTATGGTHSGSGRQLGRRGQQRRVGELAQGAPPPGVGGRLVGGGEADPPGHRGGLLVVLEHGENCTETVLTRGKPGPAQYL